MSASLTLFPTMAAVWSANNTSGIYDVTNATMTSEADGNASAYEYMDYGLDVTDTVTSMLTWLNIYATPVIVFGGILGNVVSIGVFLGTPMRAQNSSIYLAALSFADTLFLFTLFIAWFGWVGVHVAHRPGWCQIIIYLSYVSSFLSVWTVVSFTVERYIAVCHPFYRHIMCSVRRALYLLAALAVIALLTYSPSIAGVSVKQAYGRPVCSPVEKFKHVNNALMNLDTVVTLFIPSVAIITLNVLIAVRIYRTYRERQRMTGGCAGGAGGRDGVRRGVIVQGGGRPVYFSTSSSSSGANADPDRKHGHHHHAPRDTLTSKLSRDDTRESRTSTARLSVKTSAPREWSSRSSAPKGRETRETREPRETRASSPNRVRRAAPSQRRTTKMLLLISTIFVLLNAPSHAMRIHAFIVTLAGHQHKASSAQLKWQELFQLIYYINFAINFILYSLCARQFRRELFRIGQKLRARVCGLVEVAYIAVSHLCRKKRRSAHVYESPHDVFNLKDLGARKPPSCEEEPKAERP